MPELAAARKEFMSAHRAWEAVNNPNGFESGQVHTAFDVRTQALLAYVQIKAPFRAIYALIKARGAT